MTISEAVDNIRRIAHENHIDLSMYDDEDLIVMSLNYYSHNIVDIFEMEEN